MTVRFTTQQNEPLHPKLLWARPLNSRSAGRLLIVGGHSQTIAGVQTLYQLSTAGGIGECRLAVPDVQSKLLGPTGLASFLPTTPSGSIAKGGLGQLMYLAEDFDAVLIGADLTANSETATVIEQFLLRSQARAIVTNEALDALKFNLAAVLQRPNTLVVCDMAHIAHLSSAAKLQASSTGDGPANKVDIVASLAQAGQADYLVVGSDCIVATPDPDDTPVITPLPGGHIGHRLPLATSLAAVLWAQQRDNRVAGLATASYLVRETLLEAAPTPRITITHLTQSLTKRQRAAEDAAWG